MYARAALAVCVVLAPLGCGSNSNAPSAMAELVRAGGEAHEIAPRGAFSGLKVRFTGPRLCALEVAIDALEGSTRRLVCHTDGNQVWTVAAAGDEFLSDFAVHPSGEITLALERTSLDHDGYELVRLGVSGNVLSRQVLAVTAIPPEDRPDLPDPQFLRSEEHTSELQSRLHLVCRLLLEKKKKNYSIYFVNFEQYRTGSC